MIKYTEEMKEAIANADGNGALAYENGWIISSEDAKVLFMAKIVEKAEEIANGWNAVSEVEVEVEKFISYCKISFGWMTADTLQNVKQSHLIYSFAEYLNETFGIFNRKIEIKKFVEKCGIEFWTGELSDEYYNFGQSTVILNEILDDVFL